MGIGVSYAWLSKNTKVNANNVQILGAQIQPEITVTMNGNVQSTSDASIINLGKIKLRVPNTTTEVSVKVRNVGDQSFTLDKIGIAHPTENEEMPKVVTVGGVQKYYYLGTQVTAEILDNNKSSSDSNKYIPASGPAFLVPTVGNAGTSFSAIVNENEVTKNTIDAQSDIVLYSSPGAIQLNHGDWVEFKIRLSFEKDAENSQDVYKHFNDNSGGDENCSRRLFIVCNPTREVIK